MSVIISEYVRVSHLCGSSHVFLPMTFSTESYQKLKRRWAQLEKNSLKVWHWSLGSHYKDSLETNPGFHSEPSLIHAHTSVQTSLLLHTLVSTSTINQSSFNVKCVVFMSFQWRMCWLVDDRIFYGINWYSTGPMMDNPPQIHCLFPVHSDNIQLNSLRLSSKFSNKGSRIW